MGSKSAQDVIFSGGDLDPAKVRGTVNAWLDHVEERNWKDEQGSVPVDYEDGLKVSARVDWFNFLNKRLEEDLYELLDPDEERDELYSIFNEYWHNSQDVRETFKELSYWCHEGSILINVKAAEDQGGLEELLDEYGKQALAKAAYNGRQYVKQEDFTVEEDEEESEKGQSSFGESQFPQLHEIGVVDKDARVDMAKLKGLVMAFVGDVDEIRGEDREFDLKWAKRAFLYWGKDRFEDEWLKFAIHQTGSYDLYDAIDWVYENKEEKATEIKKKYRGNCDVSPGNPGTNDALEAFLDAEAPGWDEEDEEEEESESKSKWEEFEEKAEEIDTSNKKEVERDGSDREGSKWEKFEKEAKDKHEPSQNGRREAEDGRDADETRNTDRGSDSGSDNPNDLGDWAEKEGSTDTVHKPSRTRTKGESEATGTRQQSKAKDVSDRQTTTRTTDVECEDGGRPYPIQWPDVDPISDFERNRIYEGNTFEWSLKLPKNSVDTIVTSPPYYALRDYDIDDAFPISGDFTCDHNWEDEFCTKCGAFLGQLGHEPDPATFVEHIVDLMDRYKRVLKPSGSLWLNIGDTYAGKDIDGRVKAKNKSRMMIPERVYRRMVQTGWHLRDYVIWVKKIWMPDDDLKGNGKPFSSSSRLADQWEPMARLTPQDDPYTDVDSNRLMPPSFDGDLGSEGIEGKFREGEDTQRGKTYNELGTNPPDVWLINSDGYDGDHRAVFPEELPKRCVNITTPDRVCAECGRPYDKEVEVEDGNVLSPGGDYAVYEPRCHCDADHKPGVAFDPFLGSGTTAVAAANNGFDWAGVELSDKYAELARERIPTGRQVGLDNW